MHHDGREDNKVTTAVGPRRENLCNDVFGSLVISLGLSQFWTISHLLLGSQRISKVNKVYVKKRYFLLMTAR